MVTTRGMTIGYATRQFYALQWFGLHIVLSQSKAKQSPLKTTHHQVAVTVTYLACSVTWNHCVNRSLALFCQMLFSASDQKSRLASSLVGSLGEAIQKPTYSRSSKPPFGKWPPGGIFWSTSSYKLYAEELHLQQHMSAMQARSVSASHSTHNWKAPTVLPQSKLLSVLIVSRQRPICLHRTQPLAKPTKRLKNIQKAAYADVLERKSSTNISDIFNKPLVNLWMQTMCEIYIRFVNLFMLNSALC